MMKIKLSAEILFFLIFLTFKIGYSSSLDNGYYKAEGNCFLITWTKSKKKHTKKHMCFKWLYHIEHKTKVMMMVTIKWPRTCVVELTSGQSLFWFLYYFYFFDDWIHIISLI